MRRPSAAGAATYVLLGLIAVAALALRLWNNDHGLPFVYNVDERSHFGSHAVEMVAEGSLDPGYYQNPSGFTYLVYAALRLAFDDGSLAGSFAADPTAVFVLARGIAAVLGVLGVLAVFALGRVLWGARVGLVAAGALAVAFLPVAFSRLALTDVGTLAPVALAVLGSVLALERGRPRHFALAGAGAGLAIGFKYTAGLVLLPLAVAALVRFGRGRDRRALAGLGVALLAVVAAVFVTTPYLFLDPDSAWRQLAAQAGAARSPKLGQTGESALWYYLDSLGWGLGWVLTVAALAGAVQIARRDRARAAVLLAFPVALFAYLVLQERFFGRWLLPAYPVLAVLAGVALSEGAARAARLLAARGGGNGAGGSRRARLLESALLVALCVLALAQPVAADWRSARLLGRVDTRSLARAWLTSRFPPQLRIVVEPEVPANFHRAGGGEVLFMRHFEREAKARRRHYSDTLEPTTLERYRASGYCLGMTLSYVRGRVEKDLDPGAIDYYRRLERESRLVYRATPARAGAKPPPFHFDLSYNGYPAELMRPGPEVRILRLDRCRQRYGPLSGGERRALERAGSGGRAPDRGPGPGGRDGAAARGARG
jgi:hypothetical protein